MATEGRTVTVKALRRLYDEYPLFLLVAGRWRVFEDSAVPTICTDGSRLRFNPKFMENKTSAEAVFIMAHEALHDFLGHSIRFRAIIMHIEGKMGRPMTESEKCSIWELCNVAGDLAVNSMLESFMPHRVGKLKEEGQFPGCGRHRKLDKGLAMEDYFWQLWDALKPPPQQQPEPDQDQQQDGSGDDKSEGQGQEGGDDGDNDSGGAGDEPGESGEDSDVDTGDSGGESGESDSDSEGGSDGDGEGGGAGTPQPGKGKGKPSESGDGGSGDGTSDKPHEKSLIEKIGDKMKEIGLEAAKDTGSIEPAEIDDGKIGDAIRDWQTIVEASLDQVRKSCGTLPGWLQSFANELFKPTKADWRATLRRMLTDKAKIGTTFSKPNRRRHSDDFILPAQGGLGGGHIAILTDTSGSMSEDEMNRALGATSEILETFPIDVEVTMFQCDTRLIAESTRKFTTGDFPLIVPHEWRGRGGTDLSPAVAEIGRMPDRFKVLVIVTDMQWGYQVCQDPGIPTVWITTCGTPTDIPFGEIVQMDEDKKEDADY